jgi:hypothetical protein
MFDLLSGLWLGSYICSRPSKHTVNKGAAAADSGTFTLFLNSVAEKKVAKKWKHLSRIQQENAPHVKKNYLGPL